MYIILNRKTMHVRLSLSPAVMSRIYHETRQPGKRSTNATTALKLGEYLGLGLALAEALHLDNSQMLVIDEFITAGKFDELKQYIKEIMTM